MRRLARPSAGGHSSPSPKDTVRSPGTSLRLDQLGVAVRHSAARCDQALQGGGQLLEAPWPVATPMPAAVRARIIRA